MDSVIQIFKNLAKDDRLREHICNASSDFVDGNRVCAGVKCDECAYKDHESMQRAANVLTNKLGG